MLTLMFWPLAVTPFSGSQTGARMAAIKCSVVSEGCCVLGEWMSCGRKNVHRKLFEGVSKAKSVKVILRARPRGRAIGRFPIHESAAK